MKNQVLLQKVVIKKSEKADWSFYFNDSGIHVCYWDHNGDGIIRFDDDSIKYDVKTLILAKLAIASYLTKKIRKYIDVSQSVSVNFVEEFQL